MSNIDQERYHKLAEWAESDDRDIHPDQALPGRRAAEASRHTSPDWRDVIKQQARRS